jgi:ribonuclease HI
MVTMPIELHTDGSSLGNPGPSGYGFVIRYYESAGENEMPVSKEVEGKQGFKLSTNSRMEIMGVIFGIRDVIKKFQDGLFSANMINLMSDSRYFCDAVNKRWIDKWQSNDWMTSGFRGSSPQPVKNKDLWEQVIEVTKQLQTMGIILNISHIDGHKGHEFNEKADKLAVAASNDSANHLVDEPYEKTHQNRQTNFGYKTYR